jgi:hypothetical protein
VQPGQPARVPLVGLDPLPGKAPTVTREPAAS